VGELNPITLNPKATWVNAPPPVWFTVYIIQPFLEPPGVFFLLNIAWVYLNPKPSTLNLEL